MDSSNSGSFQSSSGGAGGVADEYDSTTQSISSFFNPSTNFNPNLNHLLHPPPPPTGSFHNHPPPSTDHNTFYNPSSTPIQHTGSAWTGTMRSDQNQLADFANYPINNHNSNTSQHASDHHRHQIGVTTKNPKKRTRASRRAPTTVLTTDTTNFRQMVQEFTGIPTGPFTTAPYSRRLDLFGRGSEGSLHTLRPSAQKIQPQAAAFLNSGANIVESGTTSSGNYNFDFQKQASTFLDLQNPMFSFQSLLQNSLPQESNDLSTTGGGGTKRWSHEKSEGNTSQNIGGSKLNSGIENDVLVSVSSRSRNGNGNGIGNGGDQVQGNEGSWICPST